MPVATRQPHSFKPAESPIKRIVYIMVMITGVAAHSAHGQNAFPETIRTINATRAESPPAMDGKLDDACWTTAGVAEGFITHRTNLPAAQQSIGYICYDNRNLYIAMKCMMPTGLKPVGNLKPHDTYVFSDDTVEILIDPGKSGVNYCQLVVNAYGSTFDSWRGGGGSEYDPSWDGDWQVATHIADGYWSLEMTVPFYNFGISPELGSDWGINLCRNTFAPRHEMSSTAARGDFNVAENFPLVEGIEVDFAQYPLRIESPKLLLLEPADGNDERAEFLSFLRNASDTAQKVKIERWTATDGGAPKEAEITVITLAARATDVCASEIIAVEPLATTPLDTFISRAAPNLKKLVIRDAASNEILALSHVQRPWLCEAIRIGVDDPWQAKTPADGNPAISCRVDLELSESVRKAGVLRVTLQARDTGKALAEKQIEGPPAASSFSFSSEALDWGAYQLLATFTDAGGREVVDTRAPATVLPGGKHQVKVLNNLTSELTNAAERGLLDATVIDFMNPRQGWVLVTASGDGELLLDAEDKPLLSLKPGEPAAEARRLLPVGRHSIRVQGRIEQLIVRSVPELIYSTFPAGYSMKFLRKHILPHCTTILGGTNDEAAMREWRAEGGRWITFGVAPSHLGSATDDFITADDYYEKMLRHGGFRHPLNDGIILDQIGSPSIEQKIEIAKTVSKILANPDLAGRAYQPWYEGAVFGSEGDYAMMKLVLDAGWPFSFYGYLTEQKTEEETLDDIQTMIVQTIESGNNQIPGSMRRGVATMGFWSAVATGQIQDIDPSTNFKILMELQFAALANEPALFGLYGAFWYYSPYVDEEILRWAAKLHRHYGFEGRTDRITDDPYRLDHIVNGDFEDDTTGWTISGPGETAVKTLDGYGHLQGRYLAGIQGDTILVTKRSADGPNTFSQQVNGLTPGRAYSFKMITADYTNLTTGKSAKLAEAVSVSIDNADWLPDLKRADIHSDQAPFEVFPKAAPETFENHYGHNNELFDAKNHAYLNSHWRVFRAKGKNATLTVSDWASADEPGGPIGQQIMYNYLVVEPYFE